MLRLSLVTAAVLIAGSGCTTRQGAPRPDTLNPAPPPPTAQATPGDVLPPTTPPPVTPATAPAPTPSLPTADRTLLKRIGYVRTGGFYPDEVRVVVTPGGSYQATRAKGSRGAASGELTEDQRRKLVEAFAGWDQLAPEYPARGGTADDYRIEIRYGDKTVVASDAAENLPQAFWSAYEAVSKLHQGL